MGVLPVIVAYILRSHLCEVEKLPMIVGVEDSQERYGWTAHLGPVIGRAFGGSGSADSPLGDLSQSAVYIPVFHVLHPHAVHRSLMWIETFAARCYTEGKVDATCRLNNKDFEEGRRALMGWASNWGRDRSCLTYEKTVCSLRAHSPGAAKEFRQSFSKTESCNEQ
jgi:hypothetical protein